MGNKHSGSLALGNWREERRPDARSRNWCFHSMDGRRAGTNSSFSSAISIHKSGSCSYVRYNARSSSASKSATRDSCKKNRDDSVGCTRTDLVARSLSAPEAAVDCHANNYACAPTTPSGDSVCLAGVSSYFDKCPSTSTPTALAQSKKGSRSQILDDPWVRRSGRFEATADLTRSSHKKTASCRKQLFSGSCRDIDIVADTDHFDSSTKQKMKTASSINHCKNNLIKSVEENKDLIDLRHVIDNKCGDISSHRVHTFKHLRKMWQEKFKSSSKRVRSKECEQSERSAKVSQEHNSSLADGSVKNSAETPSTHEHTTPSSKERMIPFLTNLKYRKCINRKKCNKNIVENDRLYKSNETIIYNSKDIAVNETNKCLKAPVNTHVLYNSSSDILGSFGDVTLPDHNKQRSLSSSSSDGLPYCENLRSKPSKCLVRGLISSSETRSVVDLNSPRIPRLLQVRNLTPDYSAHEVHERITPYNNRRSLKCFSLNLDTFTEEYLEQQDIHPKTASFLDVAVDQISNTTTAKRDITQRPTEHFSGQSNNVVHSADTAVADKPNGHTISGANKSTRGVVGTEIGKLNSDRCKLNLPLGRNRPSKHNRKPFYFVNSNNVDYNVPFTVPNLTTTPSTTDSGYNTENSFSCEKTPNKGTICDSPILEIPHRRGHVFADCSPVGGQVVGDRFLVSSCSKIVENIEENDRQRFNDGEDDVFLSVRTLVGDEGNADGLADQLSWEPTGLFLAAIAMTNNDSVLAMSAVEGTTESAVACEPVGPNVGRPAGVGRSYPVGNWHAGSDVSVSDKGQVRDHGHVGCQGFEPQDGSLVDNDLRAETGEEINCQVLVDSSIHVVQSRGRRMHDDQNISSGTGTRQPLSDVSGLLVDGSVSGRLGVVTLTTREAQSAIQGETITPERAQSYLVTLEAEKMLQETRQDKNEEIGHELHSTRHQKANLIREEEIHSVKQDENDSLKQEDLFVTMQMRNLLTLAETTSRVISDTRSYNMCQNKEAVCNKNKNEPTSFLSDQIQSEQSGFWSGGSLLTPRQTQQKCDQADVDNCKNVETQLSACHNGVSTAEHSVSYNSGSKCDKICTLRSFPATHSEGHQVHKCSTTPTEISREKVVNTTESKTECSSQEDVLPASEASVNALPRHCVRILKTRDSNMANNVQDVSNDSSKIRLRTTHNFFTNVEGNSTPNTARPDIGSPLSLTNSQERDCGQSVIETLDHGTKNSCTQSDCRNRGGDSSGSYSNGGGGIWDKSGQTLRDKVKPKEFHCGSVACTLKDGQNRGSLGLVAACSKSASRNVSVSLAHLQSNLTGDLVKNNGLSTANLPSQFEALDILESTQNRHLDSHVVTPNFECAEDISKLQSEGGREHVSITLSVSQLPDVACSGYVSPGAEWRSSTTCFTEQSSRVRPENKRESTCSRYYKHGHCSKNIDRYTRALSDTQNQVSLCDRFSTELNQNSSSPTVVDKVAEASIFDTYLVTSQHLDNPDLFVDFVGQSGSHDTSADKLNETIFPDQCTDRLDRYNDDHVYIQAGIRHGSCDLSVDTWDVNNSSNTVVERRYPAVSSDTFKSKSFKNSERHYKALSFSDSHLPIFVLNDCDKSTVDINVSKKGTLLAPGLPTSDTLEDIRLPDSHSSCGLNQTGSDDNCRHQGRVASGLSLNFLDATSHDYRLYSYGSAEMLKYTYPGHGDGHTAEDNKVASCTNLAEQRSKYRSKIAMGMTSARMRSYINLTKSACVEGSLRSTQSECPISSKTFLENSVPSTDTIFYQNQHACGNSKTRDSMFTVAGLIKDMSTPSTHMKHSRSLDSNSDRRHCSLFSCGNVQYKCPSETGAQQTGSCHVCRHEKSPHSGLYYVRDPQNVPPTVWRGCLTEQLPLTSLDSDLNTSASSSADVATVSKSNGAHMSTSCRIQLDRHFKDQNKNSQIVYTTQSATCLPSQTVSNLSHSHQNDTDEALLYQRQGHQCADSCICSSHTTPATHHSDSPYIRHCLTQGEPIAASENNGGIPTEYSNMFQQDINHLSINHGSSESTLACQAPAVSSSCDISTLLEGSPSDRRHGNHDRVWRYSMTSLMEEGNTWPEIVYVEDEPAMDAPPVEVCPTCQRPFDSGKKRRLKDSCGHEKCFTCLFSSETCAICASQAQTQRNSPGPVTPPCDYKPRVALIHKSTEYTQCQSVPPTIPPRVRIASSHAGGQVPPALPARSAVGLHQGDYYNNHHHSPAHLNSQLPSSSQHTAHRRGDTLVETPDLEKDSDSPPPPPPDVAQHDLMTRLGLLLGDHIHPSGITGVGVVLPSNFQEEATLNSISSLSSNEHTPEKSAADASPMSTLTASSGGELSTPLSGPHRLPATACPVAKQDVYSLPTNSELVFHRPPSLSISTKTTKSAHLQLKPLVFEVPHPGGKPIFVGRAWLFSKLESVLGVDGCEVPKSKGIIITGAPGTGKTAIVEQLVNHSCFSNDIAGYYSGKPQAQNQVNQHHGSKLTDYTALNGLGFQVVAYHICQADNSVTCMVADMVSSMAAQMAKVPQLVAYRELLLQEPYLQTLLNISECIQNPSLSFLKGILEPLRMLKNAGKIFTDCCIILVDSLDAAEFHKPDHGDTIASFLCRHANKFPDWLKLVVTVRSSLQEITSSLHFPLISLDNSGNHSDNVMRDIVNYIDHRISSGLSIKANIAINGRPNKELTAKFTSHVQNLSSGSFLYTKLVLDLIESGHLVPKSSNYTILPVNLSEVFLLHFNLKFSSARAFERVSSILSVCLASLYPLTLVEIFLTVNSGYLHQYLSWDDFCQRMDVLAGFVYCCHNNTIMFFHPAFREWLIHRGESDSPKFICDLRHGHALMAFRLSRVSSPLTPDKTIELGHHILKAHIYKTISRQLGYSSQNMQAYWMCLSSHSLDAALVSRRNVYSPNVKVSRLILSSGGNPNSQTEYLSNAPVLCVAAREGYIDMLSLLLEFGADPNVTSDTKMTPLCHGAIGGHTEVLRILCLHNGRPSAQDEQGHSAAIHAVIHGQLEAVKFLLQLSWNAQSNEPTKDEVITQCFVAAAATGNAQRERDINTVDKHLSPGEKTTMVVFSVYSPSIHVSQILEYLHQAYNGSRLNMVDSLLLETALTAACLHGRKLCVQYLLDSGADVTVHNARFFTPLLCAAKSGRWDVCDMLLAVGADLEMADQYGHTALMIAAGEGHTTVLNYLLDKGARQTSTDKQGMTALSWACLQGHLPVVELLVARGSNVNHSDVSGRSPLHLAAMFADVNIIQLLIDHKAQLEHVDLNGMRALDCAIAYNNIAVIVYCLRKGAKLGPNTWGLAAGKTDILLLLLNKLTEDGSILYKKNRIKEASQRYQYALKKLPSSTQPEESQTFQELRLSFLLNLSRCKRRMNDLQSAIDLATKALELRPKCFEALYARARARRDNRQYAAAQQDLMEALHLAPKNRELQRLLTRVKEECWEQMARYESGGRREPEMERIAEDDDDSLTADNPVLYLPAV